jgi:HD-GYP domain-containing protein (c-di-GMP phosphodiesterase class II)
MPERLDEDCSFSSFRTLKGLANMHIPDIHKKVAKRLFIGWAMLSLIIGGAVYYLQIKRVNKVVLGLAMEESRLITDQIDPDSVRQMGILKRKIDEFVKGHFIVIKIYDENKRQILCEINPRRVTTEKELERYIHPFALRNAATYHNHFINNNFFMQLLLPLHDRKGSTIAYLEGIYQVDIKTFNRIKSDIINSLILVVLIVLITSIILYPIIISLNKGLIRLSSDLLNGNIELLDVLGSAIAKRDTDTNSHNYRVTIYAIRFAEMLGLPSPDICNLIAGAFLHDIGKIGIRDNILHKPDCLTDEEYAVMHTHVAIGTDIIKKSKWLVGAREIVEFHHENFDGSGYMKGLQGSAIPLNARIFTIVDVFDALTSRRPYKEEFDYNKAMKILVQGSGIRFEPLLIGQFAKLSRALYQEIAHAPDVELESILGALIRKHFLNREV